MQVLVISRVWNHKQQVWFWNGKTRFYKNTTQFNSVEDDKIIARVNTILEQLSNISPESIFKVTARAFELPLDLKNQLYY